MQFSGKKVLVLGSGGLRIGQAGEFDYSGSQALKALHDEKIKTVLVNPNIATVQTDPGMADEVYLQPLTCPVVTSIIKKEKPDAVLLGFGGQTALNLGLELDEMGVFAANNVRVLGTAISSIRKTEDRDIFKQELKQIDVKTPISIAATTVEQALTAAKKIGYPIMLRSGFSLGGLGSGKVIDESMLKMQARECFAASPQILIEEYLTGWKEFEYEIIRDCDGNTLTICNMENMDPMGIHTGESIVVAPAQTLTNSEHQLLRNISITIANHFNIIGECNVQFAIDPKNGDYRVIELNARLSRSSALASKATGYPLALVATRLSLGWKLYEIQNSVTQKTCAYFEPALDYLVVKIPRWDTQKLKRAGRVIGTEMKSVGEVMAIGRSFPEALQKAVGMLNIGATCLSDYPQPIPNPANEIKSPTDRRLFALYKYFLSGGQVSTAYKMSRIDVWFLFHIQSIAILEKKINESSLSAELLQLVKQNGFSDKSLGSLTNQSEADVRLLRKSLNIVPFVKQIDTLAGEFSAETNYLYLTYYGTENDVSADAEQPVLILGSGPYAIGSSVEFDWCAVNTAKTIQKFGKKAVIINSNPETVSTDYDISDRLYFEQLTFERVQDIADIENPFGIVVSVGGQIANNLAVPLDLAGYDLLGTSAENIDRAENREKFSALLNGLNIDQPEWEKVSSIDNACEFAKRVDYPVLIRPSYILSGAAMNVAYNELSLKKYLLQASIVSPDKPVVISKFICDAKELEVDGVARDGQIVIEAINEHIENAGVHSGDATLVLPPQNLYLETIRRTKKITRKIVYALNISGPFNMQFIAKNNQIQVIECNLRASRSLPFVSKVTNHNFIEISTQVMLNKPTLQYYETLELDYVGVKSPQFSYQRLKGSDPVAHVEMASTGEVACIGEDIFDAFWRSWLSTEKDIKNKRVLISIADSCKEKFLPFLKTLENIGWKIFCTEGTHSYLFKNGVASYFVYKTSMHDEPNIRTVITLHEVDLIINIPSAAKLNAETDGFHIRRLAIDHHIPLITNVQKALVMLQCFINKKNENLAVFSLREMVTRKPNSYSTILQDFI